MKKIAFSAILATSIFAAPAFAADLGVISAPQETVLSDTTAYNWTGFYAGVNAGYGWGELESDIPGSEPFDIEGLVGGAQVGYNYDFGGFVLGAEADIQLANIENSETIGTTTTTAGIDYFGTIRARAGLAVDRFLPYVTGGFAWGQGSYDIDNPALSYSEENTHVGWTVGAGAEYALSDNITIRGEYLYVDLNDETYLAGIGDDTNISANFGVARAGVNFKF